MTDVFPGTIESKALVVAVKDCIFAGADEVKHTIETKQGWSFEVIVRVTKRGDIPKEAEK